MRTVPKPNRHPPKSERAYIGIDNGVSGSIGIILKGADSFLSIFFIPMPTKKEQNYTKAKRNITRVDTPRLWRILWDIFPPESAIQVHVMMERPMVNPTRFQATASALRALEATLCVVEGLKYSYSYIDSKEWQKVLLPKGTKGPPALKKASMDIGCRLFPACREVIVKHKDADGLLIAEHCRRTMR